jgi:hypothetical protein
MAADARFAPLGERVSSSSTAETLTRLDAEAPELTKPQCEHDEYQKLAAHWVRNATDSSAVSPATGSRPTLEDAARLLGDDVERIETCRSTSGGTSSIVDARPVVTGGHVAWAPCARARG